MTKYEKGFRTSHVGDCLYKRWMRVKKAGCCEEWMDYEAFCEWALENGVEYGYTLRRFNVDEPFCPDNCFWSLSKRGNPTYRADEFCARWNKTVNRIRVACGLVPFEVIECEIHE